MSASMLAFVLAFVVMSMTQYSSAYHINTRRFTVKMSTGVADFTSESAKKQIGNNAFLNKDLMSRATNGPGMKNKEKLKIGIVGMY